MQTHKKITAAFKKGSFDPFLSPKPAGTVDEVKKDHLRVNQLIKRVFQTSDGRELLEHFKSKTLDRPTEPFPWPETHDQNWAYWMHRRFREGQNNIIKQILVELEKEL